MTAVQILISQLNVRAFEVIGIPLKEPGFYIVEAKALFSANRFGQTACMYPVQLW
jgi:hypothetical protein